MEPDIEQYSGGQAIVSAMRNHQPACDLGVSR